MIKESLIEFYERDLLKLKEEISLYKDEASLWILKGEIANTTGNLCLHLVGNLNHFIGATLGNTGYIRDRDSEFSSKNISRLELISSINKTTDVVLNTLKSLSENDLQKEFPLEKHGRMVSTVNMLLHLLAHLNYHLGQINYHRRLLS
jgi:uncharacterized damage-inducible protein DinB